MCLVTITNFKYKKRLRYYALAHSVIICKHGYLYGEKHSYNKQKCPKYAFLGFFILLRDMSIVQIFTIKCLQRIQDTAFASYFYHLGIWVCFPSVMSNAKDTIKIHCFHYFLYLAFRQYLRQIQSYVKKRYKQTIFIHFSYSLVIYAW